MAATVTVDSTLELVLLDLPEPCLALILSWCTVPCVGCARRSCHALRLLTAADAELVWSRMLEAWRWRLRRREDECAESIVRRGYVGRRTQCLVAIGGCDEDDKAKRSCEALRLVEAEAPPADGWTGAAVIAGGGVPGVAARRLWRSAAPLSCPRDAPAATSDGESVYVVGGWDGERGALQAGRALRSCAMASGEDLLAEPDGTDEPGGSDGSSESGGEGEGGDEEEESGASDGSGGGGGRWRRLPSLPQRRCFGAVHCDARRRLWVVGGGDTLLRGATCSSGIHVLALQGTAGGGGGGGGAGGHAVAGWQAAGAMRRPRCGLALASDARRDTLFLVGGYSGGTEYQDTVETFDPASGRGALLRLRAGPTPPLLTSTPSSP